MKAYQLKILLKNSKPPVWRRCRIPAGITFSQLALILEHITESGACADYEYEFYQAGIQVREWRGETGQAASIHYDCLCASDTFIDGLADRERFARGTAASTELRSRSGGRNPSAARSSSSRRPPRRDQDGWTWRL